VDFRNLLLYSRIKFHNLDTLHNMIFEEYLMGKTKSVRVGENTNTVPYTVEDVWIRELCPVNSEHEETGETFLLIHFGGITVYGSMFLTFLDNLNIPCTENANDAILKLEKDIEYRLGQHTFLTGKGNVREKGIPPNDPTLSKARFKAALIQVGFQTEKIDKKDKQIAALKDQNATAAEEICGMRTALTTKTAELEALMQRLRVSEGNLQQLATRGAAVMDIDTLSPTAAVSTKCPGSGNKRARTIDAADVSDMATMFMKEISMLTKERSKTSAAFHKHLREANHRYRADMLKFQSEANAFKAALKKKWNKTSGSLRKASKTVSTLVKSYDTESAAAFRDKMVSAKALLDCVVKQCDSFQWDRIAIVPTPVIESLELEGVVDSDGDDSESDDDDEVLFMGNNGSAEAGAAGGGADN
jgi:hypothetical protein